MNPSWSCSGLPAPATEWQPEPTRTSRHRLSWGRQTTIAVMPPRLYTTVDYRWFGLVRGATLQPAAMAMLRGLERPDKTMRISNAPREFWTRTRGFVSGCKNLEPAVPERRRKLVENLRVDSSLGRPHSDRAGNQAPGMGGLSPLGRRRAAKWIPLLFE